MTLILILAPFFALFVVLSIIGICAKWVYAQFVDALARRAAPKRPMPHVVEGTITYR